MIQNKDLLCLSSVRLQSCTRGFGCFYVKHPSEWPDGIVVGSIEFIKTIKRELGVFANGRKILEHGDSYQLREELGAYIANFDSKNGNIGGKNGYIWDVNL